MASDATKQSACTTHLWKQIPSTEQEITHMANSTKFDAANAASKEIDSRRASMHHISRADRSLMYAARALTRCGASDDAERIGAMRLELDGLLVKASNALSNAKHAYRRALKQECCGQKMEARGHGFECLLCGTVMSGDSGS